MVISICMDYLLQVLTSKGVLVGCSLVATEDAREFDGMPVTFLVPRQLGR